jgi:hypothetical protein
VRQGTGLSATSGAVTLNLVAEGMDLASSVLDTSTGGLVNIVADTAANATVDSDVTAQLGSSGSQIIASALVHAVASGITDGDATTRSGGGGLINVSVFGATVDTSPEISVSVGAGADITAPTVTIEAKHNTTPPVYSDGTFNAASPTAVDISNGITGNKITFAAAHGLSTGQVVTYQTLGGTAIGGLTNGRRYSVIVPVGTGVDSTRSIQLGTIFDASYVDPLTDEVVFAGTTACRPATRSTTSRHQAAPRTPACRRGRATPSTASTTSASSSARLAWPRRR